MSILKYQFIISQSQNHFLFISQNTSELPLYQQQPAVLSGIVARRTATVGTKKSSSSRRRGKKMKKKGTQQLWYQDMHLAYAMWGAVWHWRQLPPSTNDIAEYRLALKQ